MNEILSRLDVLAAKLGQTAAVLWPHAVRHTAIEAGAGVVFWAAIVLIGVGLIAWGICWSSKNKWTEGVWYGPILAGAFISLAALMIGADMIPGKIAAALEPTGATVKNILRR